MQIKIGNKVISKNSGAFIIGEAGVNHNGSLELAKKLVDMACESRVDAVKFQTFKARHLVTKSAVKADYQIANMGTRESQIEMLKKLELKDGEFLELADYCRKRKIIFLTTPYNPEDLSLLKKMDVAAIKIASAMIVEPVFLIAAARMGKPLILSAGMATFAELARSLEALHTAVPGVRFLLMQCTTNYPAKPESANLLALQKMGEAFDCVMGYSDHTPDFYSSVMAFAMGARIFERHITLDKQMNGPDHVSSSDPVELREYVKVLRRAEKCLGDGIKRPMPEELPNIEKMRRSVVLLRDLKAGEVIKASDIGLKRPAVGIPPFDYGRVLGAKLRVSVSADTPLQWSMLLCD